VRSRRRNPSRCDLNNHNLRGVTVPSRTGVVAAPTIGMVGASFRDPLAETVNLYYKSYSNKRAGLPAEFGEAFHYETRQAKLLTKNATTRSP
jgi:hypothetical protein